MLAAAAALLAALAVGAVTTGTAGPAQSAVPNPQQLKSQTAAAADDLGVRDADADAAAPATATPDADDPIAEDGAQDDAGTPQGSAQEDDPLAAALAFGLPRRQPGLRVGGRAEARRRA